MDATRISDSEFAVMEAVWKHDGPVTFAQIRKALNGSEWAAATIRTMVRRLCKKGVLTLTEGDVYTFAPTVTREAYMAAETRDLVGRVYGGDVRELLAALVNYHDVGEQDLEDLKTYWRRGRERE